ncbi:MAG: hypothetical protein NVS3B16_14780 [Vulcanimicrobiaceae bacterium]
MSPVVLGFVGVGLEVFVVAWVTLAILVFALLAAAARHFFRSVGRFDDDVREATMDLDPIVRRRFSKRYAALRPKNAAVAWFLAVAFGPAGANLYREKWGACFAALVTLNGLGAWWLESWYTTPHLVVMENRKLIAWALQLAREELAHEEAVARQPNEATADNRFEVLAAR